MCYLVGRFVDNCHESNGTVAFVVAVVVALVILRLIRP